MVLGQAPEGARPWLELGMGHEEPDKRNNSFLQSHLYTDKHTDQIIRAVFFFFFFTLVFT